MKKIIILAVLSLSMFSCKLTDSNSEDENANKENLAPSDSAVVNDKDENGCLASAGYIWSKVNKECVKCYTGIQLNPIGKPDNDDETLSAYVLFNEDASLAEVFLPNSTTSLVLIKNGKSWVLQDWQLIPGKGYLLKKAKQDMFAGDGEIGKKITETDTEQ